MTKVFIDGSEGTTGLRIQERLEGRSDLTLLHIPGELRKDTAARKELLNQADVAILCLPDAAAVEAVSLIENPNTVVLDASTAHRVAPGWQYGFAELGPEFRAGIASCKRVANPGCHASGFLALARPLVQAGLMPADYPAVCHSLTGYSGGGKKMIAQYQDAGRSQLLDSPRQYGLTQTHKHQPEMQVYSGLSYSPVFNPIVADFYAGMEVSLPLITRLLNKPITPADVRKVYQEFYSDFQLVQVAGEDDPRYLQGGFAASNALAGSDGMVICVTGNADRIQTIALFDNLGKGASGAAVQNLNIIMGADEATGLVPLPRIRQNPKEERLDMEIKLISGSVSAPEGFTASGVHCGIRKSRAKRDLALIYSEQPCSAAAVYTTNKVKGAPILVDQKNLANGMAQAVICNSGNANTCNANGIEIAEGMCRLTAEQLGIDPTDVIVASTGVIGQPMSLDPIAAGIPGLVKALSKNGDSEASEAIMTTDTIQKEVAVSFQIGGVECKMGAIAKGSGMIHPNMATMLGFVTTDAAITPSLLQKALSASVADTYNMVSVDGDTSTNDTVAVLANGMSGAPLIESEGEDYNAFCQALTFVNEKIARLMASDGEGATKLLVVKVSGAADIAAAKTIAKSVCCSSLFKAAMFGADANWGRVLCAIGYADAPVDVNQVAVSFASCAGQVDVCRDGAGIPFSEELAKTVLSEKEIDVLITLGDGSASATAYGCDLTYDYVKINGDYRT